MALLKKNQEPWIFRLSTSNHGIFSLLLLFLFPLPHATAQLRTAPPPPPEEFATMEPKFNSTMAVVMVVLISVFLLMGFFSVYIRQCTQRRSPRNNTDPYTVFLGGTNYLSRRISRGLDSSVINTFPTFVYSAVKGLKIGKGSLECAVCLNEFEDDETLRLIPKCSHVFHTDCIDAWLASHTTCPVCRANLVPQPGENVSCVVQLCNLDNDLGEHERSPDDQEISQVDHRRDRESPDVNLINQNRPPRSKSTGWRLAGLFPRSHSTGHSLVQPGENCERYTLRLPEEVRNELIKSNLNRSKSCVAFPRMRSSRRGFRSGSGGFGRSYYERFDRETRSGYIGFSVTPPFISRNGSVRPPNGGNEVTCAPPKRKIKFVKSSSDRLNVKSDNDGAGSINRHWLRSNSQV